MTPDVLLQRDTAVGRITVEPLDIDRDGDLLHAWVTHPRSERWGMGDSSVDDVYATYAAVGVDPHHEAWLGRVDGTPSFLAETYDPESRELGRRYDWRLGDIGMRLLVAPTDRPRSGFTTAVFRTVMDLCLDDPRRERVVVVPDARHTEVQTLLTSAGFRSIGHLRLPDRVAALSLCSRADFEDCAMNRSVADSVDLHDATAHLAPEPMQRAHRFLAAKIIAEMAHERIFDPAPVDVDHEIVSPDGRARYRFHAHRHELDHWVVGPWSIARMLDDQPAAVDALELVIEHAELLGLTPGQLPTYLEELSSTLETLAWRYVHSTTSVRDLVRADYQTVEAATADGHPSIVADGGRIGFSLRDRVAHGPEAAQTFSVVWVAARRELTYLSTGDGTDERSLYGSEVDASSRQRFAGTLRGLGLDPSDYLLIPVHPWQWAHKIAVSFAADIGRRDLVLLGPGDDEFQAQQSVRTLFDVDRPDRHYVTTALSLRHLGVMKGLSSRRLRGTPAVSDWVAGLVAADDELLSSGFDVLRERASVGYIGDTYHSLMRHSPHTGMLAARWTESPVGRLQPGERLVPLSALLHRDRDGASFAVALIRASGLDPYEWVRRYLRAFVRPLVHCLYRYGLSFRPTGDTVVLVLDDHAPQRIHLKLAAEEVAVMGDLPLPHDVERIRTEVPDDVQARALLADVFDGFLRHLSALLAEEGALSPEEFWYLAALTIREHQADHPELDEAFDRIDLFTPELGLRCPNRRQLGDTAKIGSLQNPIARYVRR